MSIDDHQLSALEGLVEPQEMAAVFAAAALEDVEIAIDERDPSFHSARFAALKAAELAIDFFTRSADETLVLGREGAEDGHTA